MEQDRPIVIETEKRGGAAGWVIVALMAIAIVAGAFFLFQMSGSEAAKNNAIANAADNVGNAARDVGDAAKTAADNVGPRTDE